MFCSKCGSEISDSSKFCPKCGTKVLQGNFNIKIPDDINLGNISANAQNFFSKFKKNISAPDSLINSNKTLYFSGGLFFFLEFVLFFFPMIKLEVLFSSAAFDIFDLWEEADLEIAGFVKAFMIIFFVISLLSYFAPLILKKQNAEKFFNMPIITSILSFLIFLITVVLAYISLSESDYGDMSDYISLKAGAWFYIIFFVLSVITSVFMKRKSKLAAVTAGEIPERESEEIK